MGLRQSLKTSALASHLRLDFLYFHAGLETLLHFVLFNEGVNISIDLRIGIRSTYKPKASFDFDYKHFLFETQELKIKCDKVV